MFGFENTKVHVGYFLVESGIHWQIIEASVRSSGCAWDSRLSKNGQPERSWPRADSCEQRDSEKGILGNIRGKMMTFEAIVAFKSQIHFRQILEQYEAEVHVSWSLLWSRFFILSDNAHMPKEATQRAIIGQTFLSEPCFEHYCKSTACEWIEWYEQIDGLCWLEAFRRRWNVCSWFVNICFSYITVWYCARIGGASDLGSRDRRKDKLFTPVPRLQSSIICH